MRKQFKLFLGSLATFAGIIGIVNALNLYFMHVLSDIDWTFDDNMEEL